MTVGQTSGPNLSWLDEELRREKGIVEELRDTVDKQQITLVDQAQRIINLEDRLTRLQNQLQAIPEVRQTVQNTRDEIAAMVGELRQEVQKRETESLRNRQAEREKDVRAVQEIRAELERLTPLEQAVVVGRAEDRRINEGLMRLQQQLEALSKTVPQHEEARRQLADGIARNVVEIGQIGEQVDELLAGRPAIAQRLLALENSLTRQVQQIGELQSMRQEITAQQQEWQERQRRTDRERAQVVTEWGRRLDGFAHQMEAWADQVRHFADQHDKNRKVLRDVQMLAQDLSQQQDRLRQLQHIAEEQLRRELREARTENDQRWAQELERREQVRREAEQQNDRRDLRLTDLEAGVEDVGRLFRGLDASLRQLAARIEAEGEHRQELLRRTMLAIRKEFDALTSAVVETYGIEE